MKRKEKENPEEAGEGGAFTVRWADTNVFIHPVLFNLERTSSHVVYLSVNA